MVFFEYIEKLSAAALWGFRCKGLSKQMLGLGCLSFCEIFSLGCQGKSHHLVLFCPTFCAKSSGPLLVIFLIFILLLGNFVTFHQILVKISQLEANLVNLVCFSQV